MRNLPWMLAGLLAASTASSSRSADDAPDPVGTSCPGAAAWYASHPDQSVAAMKLRDAARTPNRPELLAELERRVASDQAARRAMLADRGDDALARAVNRVDADNDDWLIELFKKDGVPDAAQVGEQGLHLTWLLVQHADRQPQLQQIALAEFARRYQANEFSGDDLARLTDRVLLEQGKKQRYGTQFDWSSGQFDPRQVKDIASVDTHRGHLGLMPLSDYACVMNQTLRRLIP